MAEEIRPEETPVGTAETEASRAHATTTTLVLAPSGELDAGSDIRFKVQVKCNSGCNLGSLLLRIVAQDGSVLKAVELPVIDMSSSGELLSSPETLEPVATEAALEMVRETEEFTVKAPIQPGPYQWAAVFSAQEKGGVRHEASSMPFSFVVKPHKTSMNVWDVETPVANDSQFTVKVGVLCSAGCKLTGKKVQVFDQSGAWLAAAVLGDQPWSTAGPLYWAEISLQAPATTGLYGWSVQFATPEDEMGHQESSMPFFFMTAQPPEHLVTIKVIDDLHQAPMPNVDMSLLRQGGAPYRTRTDASGIAKLNVPKGSYKLGGVLMDYLGYEEPVEIKDDATFEVVLVYHPDLGA